MLGTIAGALIGSLLVVGVLQRRNATRQDAATACRPFDVPVKIRLLDESGLQGRWRDGVLYRVDDQLLFRPRRPRIGRRLDLTGLTIAGRRQARFSERWWFAGRTVLLVECPIGRAEIATGTDELLTLATKLIQPTNDA
jgi:hypothetical protein